ncbi:MAG: response regulator transcription factor, partial [Planctomycetota bacterium]|nr:response regulator transcription factor [Planctomycetota bacterium]
SPHVLLLEIDFEGCGVFGLCSEIATHSPDVRFVFLTTNDADVSLKAALDLSAGYLLKTDSLDDVVAAVGGMEGDSRPFSTRIANRMRFDRVRNRYVLKKRPPVTDLTSRQVEVLRHIARGRTTREIAADLQLTPNGVESQKHRIMHKLKIHDRVGLARYAIREGLLLP